MFNNPTCHSEPFAFCHSEGAKAGMNSATTIVRPLVGSGLVPDRAPAHQDKLREECFASSFTSFRTSAQDGVWRPFAIVQGDNHS